MYCRNAPKDLVGAGTADNERLRQQDQEKEKASLHLLWHTWAGKEIERRTDNDKRRVNEYVKKDLKNRLAELGKKAQALSGQELTDAMDEAVNIGEILDEIKTREELMAAAAAAGNNDPEPGKGSEPGEGGEEPKTR